MRSTDWKRPLWLAVPLILAAGYLAVVSRFTWLFAPAMWSVMLEFARAPELNKAVWRRSIAVGIAGVFGGYAAPFLVRWIHQPNALIAARGAILAINERQGREFGHNA